MTHALTADSRLVAQELHALLHQLDPARWRDDLEGRAREQIRLLQQRLHALLDGTDPSFGNPMVAALRDRLREVAALLEQHLPDKGLPVETIRLRWEELRRATMPAYEQLAAHLRAFDIHVPSLRPTNYWRNVFHAGNGLLCILLVQHVLSMTAAEWVAGAAAAFAWSCEGTRRFAPRWNRVLMAIFGKVAHPHETWRVNSGTWFTTALFLLALLHDPMVGCLALAVLGFADPAAALVGRRFGTVRLVHGRSLEGTLAFFGVGALASYGVLTVYYPEVATGAALAVALSGAAFGAVAELVSRRIDDNLSVPLGVAAGALLALRLIGG